MTRRFTVGSSSLQFAFAICLLLLFPPHGTRAGTRQATAGEGAERIRLVVDRLKSQMGIPEPVAVSVLPSVALVVSVEAPRDGSDTFRLSIEDQFLTRLNTDEIDAAVAHELGHVWVFTHHPYLQTERLANQIAMRVVSRDSLVSVYEKVWRHAGTKGDLVSFLGP